MSGVVQHEQFHDLRFLPMLFFFAGIAFPALGAIMLSRRPWFGGIIFFGAHLLVSLLSLWSHPLVIRDGRILETTWVPLQWAIIGGILGIGMVCIINAICRKGR